MSQYDIPTENLPKLMTIIEKLNRKAVKLGVPPITFTLGARGIRQVDIPQARKNDARAARAID